MFIPIVIAILLGTVGEMPLMMIVKELLRSLLRLFSAYFVSLFLAYVLAIWTSQSVLGDYFILLFDMLQNLPSFALIPLFAYIFGYTNEMAVVFTITSVIWPILFYILHSLKMARTDLNDAATVFGANSWNRIFYYLIPLSFPAAVTGSIVAFNVGWESIIGIEIIGLTNGIGFYLNNALYSSRELFAFGLSVLLLFVFVLNRLVWMPLLKKSQLYEE